MLLPVLVAALALTQPAPPKPTGPEKWESDIAALEALDKKERHPQDSILFVGSSSIRLWKTIDEDMAPYHPIRRGYGGAKYSDLKVYAKRLVHPHRFRAMAIFVANDVSGKSTDRTPEAIGADVESIIRDVRSKFADTPIFFIAVTPTAKRWKVWRETQGVNAKLAEICSDHPNVHWIPTASHYLNDRGEPRTELFIADKLHLNEAGYDLWAKIIKARLNKVLSVAE